MLTKKIIKALFPKATRGNVKTLVTVLNTKGKDFGITNANILAHYLAQVGHETGYFKHSATVEKGFYKLLTVKKLWGTKSYLYKRIMEEPKILKNQKRFYNVAYSNQNNRWLGNGNEASGDGYKFRGRGYIQLTGRANYKAFTKAYNKLYNTNENFERAPSKLTYNRTIAIISSLWYFQTRTLPAIKKGRSFYAITGTINAGRAGLEDRKRLYKKATKLLTTQNKK